MRKLVESFREEVKTKFFKMINDPSCLKNKLRKIAGLYESISEKQHHENCQREHVGDYGIRIPQSLPGVLATAYKKAEAALLNEKGQSCPCHYAVVGMGSMALQQATPYSDLEFLVIIESYSTENKMYFQQLTQEVEKLVIALGETPGKPNNPDNKKGIRFDSWNHTALNDQLIGTIDHFIQLLNNYDQPDKLLYTMLEVSNFVYGKITLFQSYHKATHHILKRNYEDHKNHKEHGDLCRFFRVYKMGLITGKEQIIEEELTPQELALKPIQQQTKEQLDDINKFLSGKKRTLCIKQSIYRIAERIIYLYSGMHGWFQENIFQLTHRLIQSGIINEEKFNNLSNIICFALELKLLHHFYNNASDNPNIEVQFVEYINKEYDINRCKQGD